MANHYDFSWECPHAQTDSPLWQESDWYVFYDWKAGVGGWHRIGHQPNLGNGQVELFVFEEGEQRFLLRFPQQMEIPLGDGDRTDTLMKVGTHRAEALGHEVKHFMWEEKDCAGDLTLYDAFYPPRDWSKFNSETTLQSFAKVMQSGGKLQSSGRVRGQIRIGRRTIDIDGLLHRDRAWGVRDNTKTDYRRLRMFSGTVGPKLSFASATLDLVTGERPCVGFIVRDEVQHEVRSLRVAPWIDADGYSVLGARAEMTLDNGENFRLEARVIQGFLHVLPRTTSVVSDMICSLEWEGHQGFCDLAITNNPGRGAHVPEISELITVAFAPGLSDFVDSQI